MNNIPMCYLGNVSYQSIMHKLDECFILDKGTVWRGITDIQHITYGRTLHKSNIPMCYLGNVSYQSIMHKLDECFILGKGTVWRGITDI